MAADYSLSLSPSLFAPIVDSFLAGASTVSFSTWDSYIIAYGIGTSSPSFDSPSIWVVSPPNKLSASPADSPVGAPIDSSVVSPVNSSGWVTDGSSLAKTPLLLALDSSSNKADSSLFLFSSLFVSISDPSSIVGSTPSAGGPTPLEGSYSAVKTSSSSGSPPKILSPPSVVGSPS